MKLKTLNYYITHLSDRCTQKFGRDYTLENEELIACAARNKRLLDRFDNELDSAALTVVSVGSMGQQKEDINPIIKHRNDVAKLYQDNLEALMLTPRARYKKSEAQQSGQTDELAEFLRKLSD